MRTTGFAARCAVAARVVVALVTLLLGGMGTLAGPVLGAAVFLLLENVLSAWTVHWQAILGPLLVLVVLHGPSAGQIFPLRSEVTVIGRDGRMTALSLHVLANTGAYGSHALTVPSVTGSRALSLYQPPNTHRYSGSGRCHRPCSDVAGGSAFLSGHISRR